MIDMKILLVDDHPIVLEGCKSLLEEQYPEILACTSVQDAQKTLLSQSIDLLITDHQLGNQSGLELVSWLKQQNSGVKVLVLSMVEDASIIKKYMELDVAGYVLKNDIHATLSASVERVLAGKHAFSDEVTELLLTQKFPSKDKPRLSPREEEILRLIVEEKSTKEISELLFISDRTVETHRKNILRKTGCSNLVALVKFALQHNMLKG